MAAQHELGVGINSAGEHLIVRGRAAALFPKRFQKVGHVALSRPVNEQNIVFDVPKLRQAGKPCELVGPQLGKCVLIRRPHA